MSNTLRLFLRNILLCFVWFVMKEVLLYTSGFMLCWIKCWHDQTSLCEMVGTAVLGHHCLSPEFASYVYIANTLVSLLVTVVVGDDYTNRRLNAFWRWWHQACIDDDLILPTMSVEVMMMMMMIVCMSSSDHSKSFNNTCNSPIHTSAKITIQYKMPSAYQDSTLICIHSLLDPPVGAIWGWVPCPRTHWYGLPAYHWPELSMMRVQVLLGDDSCPKTYCSQPLMFVLIHNVVTTEREKMVQSQRILTVRLQ